MLCQSELTTVEIDHDNLSSISVSLPTQLDRVSNGMQQLESTTRDKQQTLTEEMVGKQLELSTLRGRVAEYEKRLEDTERECHEQKQLIDGLKEDYSSSKSQVRYVFMSG